MQLNNNPITKVAELFDNNLIFFYNNLKLL